MNKEIVLTGITTTGTPHLGNYVGAIRPAIEASRKTDTEAFYFLADYHAIISCHDPVRIKTVQQRSCRHMAGAWVCIRTMRFSTDNLIYRKSSNSHGFSPA